MPHATGPDRVPSGEGSPRPASGPDAGAIIVGAGPAGLAVAARLRRSGTAFVLLEASRRVGDSWRRHYERLRLHTHKGSSALPFRPWPRSAPSYPTRDEVAAYLEAYAREEGLEPRLGEPAVRGERTTLPDGAPGWAVRTPLRRYRAPHLVVCTGLNEVPHVPGWPGDDAFAGALLHAADYRTGRGWADRDVLVVGFGNSGAEIALDLAEHGARVALAVRSPVNVVPRRVLGVPVETAARLLARLPAPLADRIGRAVRAARYGDLPEYGLRLSSLSPVEQVRRLARIPVVDVGILDLVRSGAVRVYPGVERFHPRGVRFADGRAAGFDAVVLATGYRPGFRAWLEEDVGAEEARAGTRVRRGLHFCGFRTEVGGTLGGIRRESARVARAALATGS